MSRKVIDLHEIAPYAPAMVIDNEAAAHIFREWARGLRVSNGAPQLNATETLIHNAGNIGSLQADNNSVEVRQSVDFERLAVLADSLDDLADSYGTSEPDAGRIVQTTEKIGRISAGVGAVAMAIAQVRGLV